MVIQRFLPERARAASSAERVRHEPGHGQPASTQRSQAVGHLRPRGNDAMAHLYCTGWPGFFPGALRRIEESGALRR